MTREEQEDAAFAALPADKQQAILGHIQDEASEFNALRALVSELRERLPGITEEQSQHVGNYLLKALWLGWGRPHAEVFGPIEDEERRPHLRLVPLDAPGPAETPAPAPPAEPSNVVEANVITKLDIPVERILQGAVNAGLSDVFVIGYDAEGDLFTSFSFANGPEALWMLELAKKRLMEIGDNDDPQSPFFGGAA